MAILSRRQGKRFSQWKRLFYMGAAFWLSPTCWAQEPRVVGPGGGGAMFHVTINPVDSNEVLLSCDMTGAYISHDAGYHWRMFNLRGSIHFFAFDSNHPGTIYAATDVLWRSTNDGHTWRMVWPRPAAVRAILMDSDHADETVVARPDPIGNITSLAVDPKNSRLLYATSQQQNRSYVIRSQDGGLTWSLLHSFSGEPLHIWIDPRSPRRLRDVYVATAQGMLSRIQGIWQEGPAPAGESFRELSLGFSSEARSLEVLYGVTEQAGGSSGLVVSTDRGKTWRPSPLPDQGAQIRTVATSLLHPEVAYASFKRLAVDGRLFQGVARTNDTGAHWELIWRSTFSQESDHVHDAWIAAAMTPEWTEEPLSLAVDDRNPKLVYATDLGRTVATTDGGRTWAARYSKKAGDSEGRDASWISTGLDVTTTYGYLFDPFDRKRRFILTTDIGLFRSEDGGRSWMRSVDGVPGRWRNTTYSVVFDPQTQGKMWAAMSDIHDLPRPKMWRHRSTSEYIGGICVSQDGGRTWKASSQGMPSTAPTSLLVDPTTPVGSRTLWAATMGHGIYRSEDDGRTWKPANDGIVQENALGWRLARSPQGTLYALIARRSEDGSIGNSGDGALYRSTDRGDHWHPVALPKGANAPNGIAIDPEDPDRIYLALWARATPEDDQKEMMLKEDGQTAEVNVLNGIYGGLAVSTDGGRNWRWTLTEDHHIYDVTIDPHDSRTLYATGFESSAWISHDRGEHWVRIPGFNFKWGHRVQADPEDAGKVYISTFGGGVWHVPVSGPEAQDIATPAMMPR